MTGGQYEGAKVLGLSYAQTMRRIVIPQVWPRILPPLSNETITLVKDTSLIYVLALNDLLRARARYCPARLYDHAVHRGRLLLFSDDLGVDLGLPVPGETLCQV